MRRWDEDYRASKRAAWPIAASLGDRCNRETPTIDMAASAQVLALMAIGDALAGIAETLGEIADNMRADRA